MSIPVRIPPQTIEVLPGVSEKLNVSAITDLIGTDRIFVASGDSLDVPFPSVDDENRSARIVLMASKPQSSIEHLDKSIAFRFKVRCDLKPIKGDPVEMYLSNLQTEVFRLLQWQLLTLTKARQLFNLHRIRPSINVFYEKDENFYFNASEWSILLTSTDN